MSVVGLQTIRRPCISAVASGTTDRTTTVQTFIFISLITLFFRFAFDESMDEQL